MRKMIATVGILALLIIGGISQAIPAPLVPSGSDGGSQLPFPLPLVPFGSDGGS